MTWDDNGPADAEPGNGLADRPNIWSADGPFSDPAQAQIRIDAVQAGVQDAKDNQKGEGVISVSFRDNNFDGKLTAGDTFDILGNGAIHTANDDYRLEIKFDLSGDTIGSFKLGA